MNEINLQLKAKHFHNTEFCGDGKCAIEKAASEMFNTDDVVEGLDQTTIDEKCYVHSMYRSAMFKEDKALAESHGCDDTIIREIKLTSVE